MQYMLLIYADENGGPAPDSPEAQENWGAWMRISEEMGPVTVSGAPLQPKATATTVRVDGAGEPVVSDGPFAETKEVLGGYYIIDVPDLDTALGWAAKLPNVAQGGSTEVRPVMGVPAA
jgi:hypothetical protein